MKRMLILISLLFATAVSAQNEFAATSFYNEFKKIFTDGQAGFNACKGSQRKTGFEEIATEFHCKCHLTLSDSGKIIFPKTANPYAIYYFQPDKLRLKIDQQGVNLRDAVIHAYDKPLFSRSETFLVNERPFTNTYFFTDANETRGTAAVFRQCIYYADGKYLMSFEIRGKDLKPD